MFQPRKHHIDQAGKILLTQKLDFKPVSFSDAIEI